MGNAKHLAGRQRDVLAAAGSCPFWLRGSAESACVDFRKREKQAHTLVPYVTQTWGSVEERMCWRKQKWP
jgi:hypothetical protein